MERQTVSVVGAGTIGADVALDLALNQYHVLLKDLSSNLLRQAEKKIKDTYRFAKMMRKSDSFLSLEEVMNRIELTTDYQNFDKAFLIIENITEEFETKKKFYYEMDEICNEDAIYGVNTSCISITKIAALTGRPENVIGTHFMNPVPLSKLVEIIKGYHTSNETVEKIKTFVKSIKKTYVIVNDFPGFAANRVMMLTINEAIWLVHDRVADPKAIDQIFKLGFGHKMGPLATGDLIGLDTILKSLYVLYESYNDPKYRPCPLLQKMVDAQLLGKKSGQGFFKY